VSKRIHEFEESKKVGDKGENLLEKYYGDYVKRLDGRENDFVILNDNRLLEQKSDQYRLATTPNFFMERYSNDKWYPPGGPWQALEKGSNVYLYYFMNDKTFFWFDSVTVLVETLEVLTRGHRLVEVYNRPKDGRPPYNTLGFLVKREQLKDLYKTFKLGETLPI
jgi:hypothetical protein